MVQRLATRDNLT